MADRIEIRRALVSVYDKTGLVELGKQLTDAGVEIVSTGSTAATLAKAGIPVTGVEDVTGFPECLDGRVKTLHPKIHAGILADRRLDSHVKQLAELGVAAFDLVVTNLYPFTQTVASGATQDECVEQIDIGGPSMVRAAAKNHPSVAVLTSPTQYDSVAEALAEGGYTLAERQILAKQAFIHTASYDVAVATWMTETFPAEGGPEWMVRAYHLAQPLRYGENSHQTAALYVGWDTALAQAEQLGGKEMSYNNYVDTEAAYRACYDHADPAVAIIKHANPCGIAVGSTIAEAHLKAHACDPLSAYGGVVAANREVTVGLAENLAEIFTEVIIAPGFEPEALEILKKKKNLRILQAAPYPRVPTELRPISGGMLVQTPDYIDAKGDDPNNWELKAGSAVDEATLRDLAFAWKAVRAVKSNAILLADAGASVGVGMGQVNRVDSCKLAIERAGDRAPGSVAASDAFFPFADGPKLLIEAGVRAIVQPGGSIRDQDVIDACEAAGVALYFTGVRHFFH
ncbi:MAG: bifunctional phosphoribosylaminoimidazolecarboxamide formyltransferase/IMP cyclohydrolase [Propionibacteriaceae bacterium]|jgi:phosphoribosylaminoimidazolecarboxamide formyltransferase/IMP cyclohydrolase|nr:bifunctional phosphoribosylaminoimidazolecarboxamide formyltransferase/IMP cyclohydrolase [Propionibacteriaceae bacterium]